MRWRSAWPMLAVFVVVFAGCSSDETDCPTCPTVDPVIELVTPSGGEIVAPGAVFVINWTASEGTGDAVSDVTLSYTADGMTAYTTIASGLDASGSYDWTAPSSALYGVKIKATATIGGETLDSESSVFAVVTASQRGYVTSAVCNECHSGKYDMLYDSGHPYKLSKVVNDEAPTWPFSTVPAPPTGYEWSDITYVIGGYGWKARFLDENGYIVTSGYNGGTPQYNLERSDLGGASGLPSEWVTYETGATQPKSYTCGTCHTTGWLSSDDNGGVYQDGLVGIRGTWEEPGIGCEACHGVGADHVATKSAAEITVDTDSELCGSCHFRDTNHGILASGGFIKHHEQFDEMISAGHMSHKCTTCHDPHMGVRYGHADEGGIRVTCISCHAEDAAVVNHFGADCIDCHMPRASKSARKVHDFEGDVRTHIFKVNKTAVGMEEMFFEEDGSTWSNGFVTLDFACYGCHQDPESGVGGERSEKTLTELANKAAMIHTPQALAMQ